jgi:hypothetical protein
MSPSNRVSSVRLADHVRACRAGNQLVFLDLRRSKYIGVQSPQLTVLCAAIFDGPADEDATAGIADQAHLKESIQRLCKQELLSEASTPSAVSAQPPLDEVRASLDIDADLGVATEWRRLIRLWEATIVTGLWLRGRNLDDIANRVEALRRRHSSLAAHVTPDAMHAAVSSYVRLRPLALTTFDRCLYDSLALIHFLGTQGLFPRWVIGVRTCPFEAHSWVQSGDVVLNDLAEHVRCYRPILVV